MTTYEKKNEKVWYTLEREEVVQQLKTCPNQGLTSSEAEWRLQTAGLNQLEKAKPVSFWQMVWSS